MALVIFPDGSRTPLARTLSRAHGAEGAQERAGGDPDADGADPLGKPPKPDNDGGPGNFAVDIDGTADAFPRAFQSIMSALTAAGHHVYVMTGIAEDTVTAADVDAKRNYLTSIGITPECYFELVVLPRPHPVTKAKAMKDNDCGVLFDNNRENVRAAAAEGIMALYLYNTREH